MGESVWIVENFKGIVVENCLEEIILKVYIIK